LRGEHEPWGGEDTALVFWETFKAAPTDDQKAYDAILAYARKRPIVKARWRTRLSPKSGRPSTLVHTILRALQPVVYLLKSSWSLADLPLLFTN
jgi:hypothetical protein